MAKIYFVDVTNRDTVQASRIIMSKLHRPWLTSIWLKWASTNRSSASPSYNTSETIFKPIWS